MALIYDDKIFSNKQKDSTEFIIQARIDIFFISKMRLII